MRDNFKNYKDQVTYMNKFIHRQTDISLECEYCGKPAFIRYSREDPYKIQLICKDCINNKHLNNKENRGLVPNLPTIDVRDHILPSKVMTKKNLMSKDNINMMQDILNSCMTRPEIYKHYNITAHKFDIIINQYEKHIDPGIKSKLIKVLMKNRASKLAYIRLVNNVPDDCTNTLAKYKVAHCITNREIMKKSNYKLNFKTLSDICNGKIEPKIRTKCLLAETLGVTVTEIFPFDYAFVNVHNYNDYLEINNRVRKELEARLQYNKSNGICITETINDIYLNTNIKSDNIYRFREVKTNLDSNQIISLIQYLGKDIPNDERKAEFFRAFI